MDDIADGWEFTVPMKVRRLPLRRCEECGKRKLSTVFYEVHDTGLNAHVDYNVCKKCMKEARERVKIENENEVDLNDGFWDNRLPKRR